MSLRVDFSSLRVFLILTLGVAQASVRRCIVGTIGCCDYQHVRIVSATTDGCSRWVYTCTHTFFCEHVGVVDIVCMQFCSETSEWGACWRARLICLHCVVTAKDLSERRVVMVRVRLSGTRIVRSQPCARERCATRGSDLIVCNVVRSISKSSHPLFTCRTICV